MESSTYAAVRKYNRRARSEKWIEAYQERAMALGDMRRATQAAEMRRSLHNWLSNNAPFAVTTYSDYALRNAASGESYRDVILALAKAD